MMRRVSPVTRSARSDFAMSASGQFISGACTPLYAGGSDSVCGGICKLSQTLTCGPMSASLPAHINPRLAGG